MSYRKEEHFFDGEDPMQGYCANCGKYVTAVKIDCGIGSYEFWGARGVHHDYRPGCPECGEEVNELATIPCHNCLYEMDDIECQKGRDTEKLDTGDECPEFEGK